MDSVVGCLEGVSRLLHARGLEPGGITHTLSQLQTYFKLEAMGLKVSLEEGLKVKSSDTTRIVDVVAKGLLDGVKTVLRTELKTGKDIAGALKLDQMVQDAELAIKVAARKGVEEFHNAWKLESIKFEDAMPILRDRLKSVRDEMFAKGFSEEQVRKALGSFNFIDATGKAIRAELNEKGQIIFKPAMEELFGESGLATRSANKAVKNSPNLDPSMNAVFGADGLITHAATKAANGANLSAASGTLEKKIETSVGGAINEASNKISLGSAKLLAGKVGEGVTALGNIMTSVPQLYNQVVALGEAW